MVLTVCFRITLSCFVTLGLTHCFGPAREESHARIFSKPEIKSFAGQYKLTYQRMDRSLSDTFFKKSFLTLNEDSTYSFDNYPEFVDTREGFKLEGLHAYKGMWHIVQHGTAYNSDLGKRQDYWGCEFDPTPGGERPIEKIF